MQVILLKFDEFSLNFTFVSSHVKILFLRNRENLVSHQ